MKDIETRKAVDLLKAFKAVRDAYSTDIKQFSSWLSGRPLTWEACRKYLAEARGQYETGKIGPNTYNKRLHAIKARMRGIILPGIRDTVARFAVEEQLKAIRPVKINSKAIGRDKVLLPGEVAKLIAAASGRLGLVIDFLYSTGCRISELTGIKKTDVSDQGQFFEVAVRGKGGKARAVKISSEILKAIHETFHGKQYIFETEGGAKYSRTFLTAWITRTGWRVLQRKISAHTLRHSFATNSIEAMPGKMKDVSVYLGHSSTAITMNLYFHTAGLSWNDLKAIRGAAA